MLNVFKLGCLFLWGASFLAQAEVGEFRLDQDRLWLTVENEPLPRLLEHFIRAGVQVEIDPAVHKTVSGVWENSDVEQALETMLSPNNYLLDWLRDSGPLGPMTRLTGIRVFREGHAEDVQPLRKVRRIETSLDGSLRFMAREILIGFGPGASIDDLRTLLARLGGTIIASNPELGVYRILLPEGANVLALLDALKRDPNIALAEPNYIYDLPELIPGAPSASSDLSKWKAPEGDTPFAVAVLDSGLLFDDNLGRAVLSAFDATNPDTPLTTDAVGHGTLMAQLAAGLLDPYGTSVGEGVPVVAIKAFADDGMADSFTLMNAMTYAVAESSGPISLSWGTETSSVFLESAINYAASKGRLIFAAVGNEPTGTPMYPAALPNVIGVAASDGNQMAEYSNYGDFIDIIAPGSAGGSQGTSVSTAYVSHIAAKYQRIHPDASRADVVKALLEAAGDDKFLTHDEAARFNIR
jgi:thermitase